MQLSSASSNCHTWWPSANTLHTVGYLRKTLHALSLTSSLAGVKIFLICKIHSINYTCRTLLSLKQLTTRLALRDMSPNCGPAPAADNISHSITLTLRAARHKSFTIKTSPALHFSFSYAKNTSETLTKHLKHESGHRELYGAEAGAGTGTGTAVEGEAQELRRGSCRTAPRHSIIVKQLRDFRVRCCCCCCHVAMSIFGRRTFWFDSFFG